LKMYFWELEK